VPDTLPGMPLQLGDRGVFVCGPEDIAPWESAPPRRQSTTPARPLAPVRGHSRAWLVLAVCEHCNHATGHYCHNHNASNWWLTTMASSSGQKTTRR
jgi:hypothetical protein